MYRTDFREKGGGGGGGGEVGRLHGSISEAADKEQQQTRHKKIGKSCATHIMKLSNTTRMVLWNFSFSCTERRH